MKYIYQIAVSLCCFAFVSHQALAAQACVPAIQPTAPTSDFIDNGNGAVTHTLTGLMWMRCSQGQVWNGTTCTGVASTFTWIGALNQASGFNTGGGFAGFTDWRVPNVKELQSIAEMQCTSPAMNTTIFPSLPTTFFYWTSSPNRWSTNLAFEFDIGIGAPARQSVGSLNHLLLVRAGL